VGQADGLVPKKPESVLKSSAGAKAYLGDADVAATESDDAGNWAADLGRALFPADDAAQKMLAQRFIVLSDDVYTFFCMTGTEVSTRIHINPETGTVAKGQFWTEESLPTESLLAGIVYCEKTYTKDDGASPSSLLQTYCSGATAMQVGGKATVGRGRVMARFVE
jgi:CRISPR-associated protein Cmr4